MRKTTAGLKGCWCRAVVFVCASYSLPHLVIVLTLRSRSTPLRSVSTWIAFEGGEGLVALSGGSEAPRPQSSQLAARRDAWFSCGDRFSIAGRSSSGDRAHERGSLGGWRCLLTGPQSGWDDGQVQTGDHADAHGSSQVGGCFRRGRCSCSFSGAQPTGSLVTTSGCCSSSLYGQAVGARTLLIARRRTPGGLNAETRTGRSSNFDDLCGWWSQLCSTASAWRRRQAQWFRGVHACGGQVPAHGPEGLLERLGPEEAMTPCTKQTGSLVGAAETKLQLLRANKDDGRAV